MSRTTNYSTPIWSISWLRAHPLKFTGIVLHLLLRTLFGVFWLAAGLNKVNKSWLSTDILERIYLDRLTEMPPDSFAVLYLQSFAIPLYKVIAWILVFGELYVAIGLLLGLTTRWAAGVSLFILFNLAIGGYYDASLLPFFILNIIFLCWSSGQWLGFDRWLSNYFPGSRWLN
ncbi:MAG: DoxX family membrane protein [Gammaproteobacteria bacterium]|nr:DoxX family membrane protein [Gammaproteobacteria bacterium]MCP4090858.1 DoxX family membrane protein [Gammaproteobacteria bacterium]MCP4275534.1 DoxX family membrane protein [Gammaproteobacteria bacterium]MCP4832256.1 DoxX family membrane protein [Gammaproteobacteria bacterium]MCP4930310.1 DoxX family membrane protein [Gammaproteobacteria bacterium]